MSFKENYSSNWSNDSVRLLATPSTTAKKAFFYIQEIGAFKTLDHYYTERTGLNSFLMIYTLSGKGHLKYGHKHYTMTAGQVMFIDCMEPHYYETDKDDLWEFLWFHFNGSSSKGYYDLYHQNQDPVTSLAKDTTIAENISTMIDYHQKKHLQREVLCSNLIMNCLSELLVNISDLEADTSVTMPVNIRRIQAYLDHHYYTNIPLDQLSRQYGFSKYHMIRLFKKYTGFTITDYIIATRISQSKALLRFSSLSVKAITYEIGFNNVSHFIKLFKKRENITPLQYRKQWQ